MFTMSWTTAIALLVFTTNHGGSDLFFFVNAFSSSSSLSRRRSAFLLPATTTIKLFPSSPADAVTTTDGSNNKDGNDDETTTRIEIRVCQGQDCIIDGAEQANKMIESLVVAEDGNVKVKGVRKNNEEERLSLLDFSWASNKVFRLSQMYCVVSSLRGVHIFFALTVCTTRG